MRDSRVATREAIGVDDSWGNLPFGLAPWRAWQNGRLLCSSFWIPFVQQVPATSRFHGSYVGGVRPIVGPQTPHRFWVTDNQKCVFVPANYLQPYLVPLSCGPATRVQRSTTVPTVLRRNYNHVARSPLFYCSRRRAVVERQVERN